MAYVRWSLIVLAVAILTAFTVSPIIAGCGPDPEGRELALGFCLCVLALLAVVLFATGKPDARGLHVLPVAAAAAAVLLLSVVGMTAAFSCSGVDGGPVVAVFTFLLVGLVVGRLIVDKNLARPGYGCLAGAIIGIIPAMLAAVVYSWLDEALRIWWQWFFSLFR